MRNNPVNFTDPTGHSECGVGQYFCEGDPAPIIQLQYDSDGNFDPQATWGELSDVEILARMLLSEQSNKLLDPDKREDVIGVAWVALNRLNAGDEFFIASADPQLGEHVILEGGQFHGMTVEGNSAWAADPENPEFQGQFEVGNANAGREAYWEALKIAEGVLDGSISDPTNGRLYYADALSDGTPLERTHFSQTGIYRRTYHTIPQIRQINARIGIFEQFGK